MPECSQDARGRPPPQSTTQARTVLQRVLRGRVTFTPRRNEISGDVDGYAFEAPTRFDRLFAGIAVERPKSLEVGNLSGTEHIGPEDMGDTDYGRLLDRAFQKGWRARRDSLLTVPISGLVKAA